MSDIANPNWSFLNLRSENVATQIKSLHMRFSLKKQLAICLAEQKNIKFKPEPAMFPWAKCHWVDIISSSAKKRLCMESENCNKAARWDQE